MLPPGHPDPPDFPATTHTATRPGSAWQTPATWMDRGSVNPRDRKARLAEAHSRAENRPESVYVRDLMSWFGASRRGYKVVDRMRAELRRAGLKTEPDFASAHIDSKVRLVLRQPTGADEQDSVEEPDVQLRVSSLASASSGVVSVAPNEAIEVACSKMSVHDYSQLAVLSGPRSLKGFISWETIGLNRIASEPQHVADAMHPRPVVVELDEPLLPRLSTVAESNFVFVRASDSTLAGIITAADITEEFRTLAGPYLLLGEIERRLRRLVDGVCTKDEVAAGIEDSDRREIDGVEDLTLGELTRLFERPDIWDRFGWRLHKATFTDRLHEVRNVRNDLMHFAEEAPSQEEQAVLSGFARFLSSLESNPRRNSS